MAKWKSTPFVIRPYMFPKGYYFMLRPTSSNYMCSPRAIMAFHVVLPFMMSKFYDGRLQQMSSDCVCSPTTMLACLT